MTLLDIRYHSYENVQKRLNACIKKSKEKHSAFQNFTFFFVPLGLEPRTSPNPPNSLPLEPDLKGWLSKF